MDAEDIDCGTTAPDNTNYVRVQNATISQFIRIAQPAVVHRYRHNEQEVLVQENT